MCRRSKRVDALIEIEYSHPRYVIFQPRSPHVEMKKNRKIRREIERATQKRGYYSPGYPPWTQRNVLSASIKDLREEDIVLNDLYSGDVSIELVEVRDESRVTVGSFADRAIQPLQ